MIPCLKKILLIAAVLCAPLGAPVSYAQSGDGDMGRSDVIPPMGLVTTSEAEAPVAEDMTHPPLNLTPDRSEILTLDAPVGSVILGNPNHVNVFADSAERLVFVPRMQGATHVTVLGRNGEILMQRNVIVAGERKNYLRIRRGCTSSDCRPTSVYYCPDNCHEIYLSEEPGAADAASSEQANEEALEQAMENMMEDNMNAAMESAIGNMEGRGE